MMSFAFLVFVEKSRGLKAAMVAIGPNAPRVDHDRQALLSPVLRPAQMRAAGAGGVMLALGVAPERNALIGEELGGADHRPCSSRRRRASCSSSSAALATLEVSAGPACGRLGIR